MNIIIFLSIFFVTQCVRGGANTTGNCLSGRIKFDKNRIFNLNNETALPGSAHNPTIDLSKYDLTADYGVNNYQVLPNGTLNLKLTKQDNKAAQGVRMSLLRYMLYGKMTVRMKGIPVTGAITTAITMSDRKDEIDFETVGSRTDFVETNVFYKGILDFGTRGEKNKIGGRIDEYHDYTIDWSKDAIIWSVDGKVVRTYAADSSKTQSSMIPPGEKAYPSTPSLVQISVWDSSFSAPGTVNWSGGKIDWQNRKELMASFDYIDIQCYNDQSQPVPSWPLDPNARPLAPIPNTAPNPLLNTPSSPQPATARPPYIPQNASSSQPPTQPMSNPPMMNINTSTLAATAILPAPLAGTTQDSDSLNLEFSDIGAGIPAVNPQRFPTGQPPAGSLPRGGTPQANLPAQSVPQIPVNAPLTGVPQTNIPQMGRPGQNINPQMPNAPSLPAVPQRNMPQMGGPPPGMQFNPQMGPQPGMPMPPMQNQPPRQGPWNRKNRDGRHHHHRHRNRQNGPNGYPTRGQQGPPPGGNVPMTGPSGFARPPSFDTVVPQIPPPNIPNSNSGPPPQQGRRVNKRDLDDDSDPNKKLQLQPSSSVDVSVTATAILSSQSAIPTSDILLLPIDVGGPQRNQLGASDIVSGSVSTMTPSASSLPTTSVTLTTAASMTASAAMSSLGTDTPSTSIVVSTSSSAATSTSSSITTITHLSLPPMSTTHAATTTVSASTTGPVTQLSTTTKSQPRPASTTSAAFTIDPALFRNYLNAAAPSSHEIFSSSVVITSVTLLLSLVML